MTPGDRLRIVQLLAPARVGGLESVVLSLAQGLRARGHDASIACLVHDADSRDPEHPFLLALEAAQVPVAVLRHAARGYLPERRALAALLRRETPQILHSHGFRADLQSAGLRASGAARLSTVHGFTGGSARVRLYEWVQCRALRRFDAAVAVARPVREHLLAAGLAPERVHLIRNAWEPPGEPFGRAEARSRLGLAPEGFVVGWIGRLSREKGPDVWLDAVLRLPGEITACFVGDGPERAGLEARARAEGLADRVRFAGERPGAARLLPAFDAVVLSSRTEGTPIVLLEAMQTGVPVVATRVGGVPDVLSSSEGWLVPAERPEALARALTEVRSGGDDTAARTRAARARIADTFSLSRCLDGYEALLWDLARSPRSAIPAGQSSSAGR